MAPTVTPVDASLFDDVQAVLGTRGPTARSQCQGYRLGWYEQHSDDVEGRRELLRDQVAEGHGLLAHDDGEPVGWCSVARREDPADPRVWAVTCFVTRAGHRRRGVMRAMVPATVPLARDAGAGVVEAYPVKPPPGKDVPWGELHVGLVDAFLDAGYRVAHQPSLRRVAVRYEF